MCFFISIIHENIGSHSDGLGGKVGKCFSGFDVVDSFGSYLEVLGGSNTSDVGYFFLLLVSTMYTTMVVSSLIFKQSA